MQVFFSLYPVGLSKGYVRDNVWGMQKKNIKYKIQLEEKENLYNKKLVVILEHF